MSTIVQHIHQRNTTSLSSLNLAYFVCGTRPKYGSQ